MATMQLPAWGGDITENIYFINWLEHPVIGNNFGLYHVIVAAKWIIGLTCLSFLFSSSYPGLGSKQIKLIS